MDFQTRYDKLNKNQRNAVDTIDGPLLVIAGPGTGKTELLSMRATNILRQTDTLPSSILCLTFTESGASNMRLRLRQIIGEDAYKIAIHTFHSFGTEIITTNRQYFFRGADTKPSDELTQHQIMRQIFESLDWQHPLAIKNGDDFTYLPETLRMISEFKQSGLTPDELNEICDDNRRIIDTVAPDIQEVFATKISKSTIEKLAPLAEKVANLTVKKLPGQTTSYAEVLALSLAHAVQNAVNDNSTKPITAWRNDWCKKDENGNFRLKDDLGFDKLRACIEIYRQYGASLADQKLFDYDDMILTVLEALDRHDDLRANLREQFQYIMVDEFQDTNNAQLQLLFAITGGGHEPNVMAVGDDDQAIFSFQGADLGNIQKFRSFYDNPPIIVLNDNYRSAAEVLEAAREVITQGLDRLENTTPDLSKKLTPHADSSGAAVRITEYASPAEERAEIAKSIKKLIDNGTEPADIAVLARQHNELIDLIPYLAQHGIRVNYERRDNALEQSAVKVLLQVAWLVNAISDNRQSEANAYLPEFLAHPALEIATIDLWKLSLNAYKNRTLWLENMLANATLSQLANWLLERGRAVHTEPLEAQLDDLLKPFHNYFFGADRLNKQPDAYLANLEALRTLRDHVRNHFNTNTPTLKDLLEFVDLTESLGTRITVVRQRAESQSDAINLMSAHKAKGLEFKHVFIIGAVDKAWGEKVRTRSRIIRNPANLRLAPAGDNYDERLRLFFVAMTRAKTTLDISYSRTDLTGKDTLIASFLSHHTPNVAPDTPDIASSTQITQTDWHARLTMPVTTDLRQVLAPVFDNYKLSATHLNNFLDISRGGPQTFLLNNLLRFPQAKTPAADYGTAIHSTLQYAHNTFRVDGKLPSRDNLLKLFTEELKSKHLSEKDFANYCDKGQAALNAFLDAHQSDFKDNQLTELSFASQSVVIGEARLTGALDLAEINPKEKTILLTDYKTGKPSRNWRGRTDYEKIKLHKYRQQLMFYQLLVEGSRDYSGYELVGARLQFVEPDPASGEILTLEDSFSSKDLARFKQLIETVWQHIVTLKLSDISGYSADYKGMLAFEEDLLAGKLTEVR